MAGNKRKHPIVLALWLALLLAACQESSSRPAGPASPTPVPTREAQRTAAETVPLASTAVLANGQLVAARPVSVLAFETGGRLLTLEVAPGDRVEAGDSIATLDDAALQEAVTSAALGVAQAENSLAQAQLSLEDLLSWAPDETAVALAQANLAAAQANLEQVQSQEALAGNNLTAVSVQVAQAQRAVADAQEAYDRAHEPARDWELNDPWRADWLKAEREGTARGLQQAQEALAVAYAQYNLTAAGLDKEAALLNAQVAILSAQQALEQARSGPGESEIAAARLRVAQAALALEQSALAREQAARALARARLTAPIGGTVLSVEVAAGALVGAGTPIVTLLDADRLEFHTNNLSERDLAQITPGQRAVVTLKAYPDQPIEAEVRRIGLQAGPPVGDAATFPVVLELSQTALDLRPGMTGRVEIEGGD